MNFYVKLAKKTVEKYVNEKKILSTPKGVPERILKKRAPVFVSIKKNGEFRACIGTIEAVKKNIIEEVIHNSISAATNDYRLGSIKKEELPSLSYEVYILGDPSVVRNIEDLDPHKYGIIVKSKDFKTSVLLPKLQGIETPEKQLEIALKKANITNLNSNINFFDDISVYRFKATKYNS